MWSVVLQQSPRKVILRPPTPSSALLNCLFFLRVVETVVLDNGVFVPCRKQVVLTKIGENSDRALYPQKKRILLLEPCTATKMTKMAGVTQTK